MFTNVLVLKVKELQGILESGKPQSHDQKIDANHQVTPCYRGMLSQQCENDQVSAKKRHFLTV